MILRGCREGRNRLFTRYHLVLREHADVYRNQPERRLRPGSRFFQVAFVIRREDEQGKPRA